MEIRASTFMSNRDFNLLHLKYKSDKIVAWSRRYLRDTRETLEIGKLLYQLAARRVHPGNVTLTSGERFSDGLPITSQNELECPSLLLFFLSSARPILLSYTEYFTYSYQEIQ